MSLRELVPWHWGKREVRLPVRQGTHTDPFEVLRHEMNRVFDGLMTDYPVAPWEQLGNVLNVCFLPRVDIAETKGDVEIKAELPGLAGLKAKGRIGCAPATSFANGGSRSSGRFRA